MTDATTPKPFVADAAMSPPRNQSTSTADFFILSAAAVTADFRRLAVHVATLAIFSVAASLIAATLIAANCSVRLCSRATVKPKPMLDASATSSVTAQSAALKCFASHAPTCEYLNLSG